MGLKNGSSEQMKEMSLIELAKHVLLENKQPLKFKDLYEKVCALKQLSSSEKDEKISQFYTDLNADGNFQMSGSNTWGLKSWYITKTKKNTKIKVRKATKRVVAQKNDDQIGDEELDSIDETIDSIQYDDMIEDLDDDFDLDLTESNEFYEEDAYS